MRPIKFRAWNVVTKTMIDLDPHQWPLCALREEENWKVMQFTGLRDKNGLTQLYEGDIIGSDGLLKGNQIRDK